MTSIFSFSLFGRFFKVAILTVMFACQGVQAFQDGHKDVLFSIQGSNTIGARLAPELLKAYFSAQGASRVYQENAEADNEQFIIAEFENGRDTERVKVEAHGSSTGFKGLLAGTADIAAASRPVKAKERNELSHFGDMHSINNEHIIGIDGLAVIVHPANPVQRLNKAQIAALFSGEITNWREVGGFDQPVHIHARDERSGTWDTFKSLVLGKKHHLSTNAIRYESNDLLSEQVSLDVAAIGFTGIASVNKSRALAIADGDSTALLPTPLNIATEDYPLARRLYFYTPDHGVKKAVKDFLAFVAEYQGQAVVSRVGFVSQNIEAIEAQLDDSVPSTFKSLVKGYKRLSVNFRFAEGRSRLDNKAQRDVGRLQRYVNEQQLKPENVLLIGYADRQSNELRAQMISEIRALAVKKAVNENARLVKSYTGYGQYLPLASASGEKGVFKNGRVEVWARL